MNVASKVCLIAIAILITAFVLSPSMGAMFLFLACFVSLSMWMQGFFSTPREVFAARHDAFKRRLVAPQKHPTVAPRAFHYPANWFALAVIWLLAIVQGGLTAVMLLTAIVTEPGVLPLAFIPFLFTSLLVWIGWSLPRHRVRIDAWGIESRQFFGTVRIAWDQIAIVTRVNYSTKYGDHYTTDYKIHSLDRCVRINERLIDCDDLLEIVEAHAPAAFSYAAA